MSKVKKTKEKVRKYFSNSGNKFSIFKDVILNNLKTKMVNHNIDDRDELCSSLWSFILKGKFMEKQTILLVIFVCHLGRKDFKARS